MSFLLPVLATKEPKVYAGIGSRTTPEELADPLRKAASYLSYRGWTLRSGGADHADTWFEEGSLPDKKEIYLPWKGFNGNKSELYDIPEKAFGIASQFHPAWKYLRDPVRRLHARNVQQVLGKNVDSPVAFVLCWTPDGADGTTIPTSVATGGTGGAIRIAASYGIPVYNLKNIVEVV